MVTLSKVRGCAVSAFAFVAACDVEEVQEAPQPDRAPDVVDAPADDLPPPSGAHFVRAFDGVRLVFSRSEVDTAEDPLRYEACAGGRCVILAANYIDVSVADASAGVVLRTVDGDGLAGPPCEVLRIDEALTIDVPFAFGPSAGVACAGGPECVDMGLQAIAGPPTAISSPVFGAIEVLGPSVTSNATSGAWGAWQHQSQNHRPGGGIAGADDTKAYDVNLNVAGGGGNLDRGAPFYAAGYGRVTRWAGTIGPGAGPTKPILVSHDGWFSGYLHASQVFVAADDYVTPFVKLGRIGGSTGYPDHLHFVAYSGVNTGPALKSHTVTFITNPVSIALAANVTSVAVGQAKLLSASALKSQPGLSYAPQPLNGADVYDQTWWATSNAAILSVSGNGAILGRSRGNAQVTLYFSGAKATRSIAVY